MVCHFKLDSAVRFKFAAHPPLSVSSLSVLCTPTIVVRSRPCRLVAGDGESLGVVGYGRHVLLQQHQQVANIAIDMCLASHIDSAFLI